MIGRSQGARSPAAWTVILSVVLLFAVFYGFEISAYASDEAECSQDISTPEGLPLQYHLSFSGFQEAWEISRSNGSVSIGVIDTGVDHGHPELYPNIDIERMHNAFDGTTGLDATMTDVYLKEDGTLGTHGTHVISVVSAVAGDGYGCDGASYNATVIPVRYVDDQGAPSLSAKLDAYRYLIELAEPPQIILMGNYTVYPDETDGCDEDEIKEFQALINEAWDMGIVTIASAGNGGDCENKRSYPACLENVISVGALRVPGVADREYHNPKLADFSNTNSKVDLTAYGSFIQTVKPYAFTPGEYEKVCGTSFSAPLAASAAALIMASCPDISPDEVREALVETAVDLGEKGYDERYGHGALDAGAAVLYASENFSHTSERKKKTGNTEELREIPVSDRISVALESVSSSESISGDHYVCLRKPPLRSHNTPSSSNCHGCGNSCWWGWVMTDKHP